MMVLLLAVLLISDTFLQTTAPAAMASHAFMKEANSYGWGALWREEVSSGVGIGMVLRMSR